MLADPEDTTAVSRVTEFAEGKSEAERQKVLADAKDCLAKALQGAWAENTAKRIDHFKSASSYLDLLIAGEDPHAFHLAFYAATQFSSLYRNPQKDTGFFSSSKPSLLIETNQTFSNNNRWETYGTIGLETSSAVKAEGLTDAITSSGNFIAKAGVTWWLKQPNYAWILIGVSGGVGLIGIPGKTTDTKETTANDKFLNTYEAGVTFKQASGAFTDSYSRVGYLRDPRFERSDRVIILARWVVTPRTADGKKALDGGLGAFIEGLINSGRGPDEARITIGVRMDLISIMKAIAGKAPESKTSDTTH